MMRLPMQVFATMGADVIMLVFGILANLVESQSLGCECSKCNSIEQHMGKKVFPQYKSPYKLAH